MAAKVLEGEGVQIHATLYLPINPYYHLFGSLETGGILVYTNLIAMENLAPFFANQRSQVPWCLPKRDGKNANSCRKDKHYDFQIHKNRIRH